MTIMDQAQAAERGVALAVAAVRAYDSASFTLEEEETLDQQCKAAMSTFRRALDAAEDWLDEQGNAIEPALATAHRSQLTQHHARLQEYTMIIRKSLIAYRQRAKGERLQQARASVMSKSAKASATEKKNANSGSSVDVTAALKRTRQVMSQEIERVSSVTKLLDDGRTSLKSSHDEYGSVNSEINQVRKRLIALKWQAHRDRMWIAAGIACLASTVLYIIHQRTGLLVI